MINEHVEFRSDAGRIRTGKIMDKVAVLVVGTASSFDNYVIAEHGTEAIFVINPLAVIKKVDRPEDTYERLLGDSLKQYFDKIFTEYDGKLYTLFTTIYDGYNKYSINRISRHIFTKLMINYGQASGFDVTFKIIKIDFVTPQKCFTIHKIKH